MNIFNTLKISALGLSAERLRMDLIADNIANAETTRTEKGEPYRRKMAIFTPRKSFEHILQRELEAEGVKVQGIIEDKSPFRLVYNPSHPDAKTEGPQKGYVEMPNIDVVTEMVDMISATRAYEANVTALNAAKSMALKALEIGRG